MGTLLDRMVGNLSPAALLTSTFFWAWFDVVPLGFAILRDGGETVHLAVLMLSLLASVIALVVVARSAKVRAAIIRPQIFAVLSVLAGGAGTALLFAGQGAASVPVLGLSAVLIGAYQATGIAVSGSVAVCQGTTNALLHIAVALPLSIVPTLLIAFLVPGAAEVVAALLPVLSALSFATYQARYGNPSALAQVLEVSLPHRKPKGRSTAASATDDGGHSGEHGARIIRAAIQKLRENRSIPVLAMVLAVTIGFGLVNTRFAEATGQSAFDEYYGFVIRAAVSALIVVGYLRFSWQPRTIFNVASLLMAVGLIGGAVIAGPASGWVFFAGYVCFDLLIWAITIGLTYRSGRCLLATIGIVQSLDQLGILLGVVLCEITPFSQRPVLWAALGVVVMALVMLLLLSKQAALARLADVDFETYELSDVNEGEGSSSPADLASAARKAFASDGGVSARVSTDSAALLQDDRLSQRLDELARRYFLSNREEDILRLLVTGRSGPYIAEELCISSNTVKTHIRHIYTKLDVHDRQELLDRALKPESDAVL